MQSIIIITTSFLIAYILGNVWKWWLKRKIDNLNNKIKQLTNDCTRN